MDDASELALISDFKRGYTYYLSGLANITSGFSTYLSGPQISESNKRDLHNIRKVLDQNLNHLIKITRDLQMELDERHLMPTVQKDFASYFAGVSFETNRVDFVIFHKTFELLKNFYIETFEAWSNIKTSVSENSFKDSEFRESFLLAYKILPAFEKIKSLGIALIRMAVLLKLENPEQCLIGKSSKPKYQDEIVYKLSSIFIENLRSIVNPKISTNSLLSDPMIDLGDSISIELNLQHKSNPPKKPIQQQPTPTPTAPPKTVQNDAKSKPSLSKPIEDQSFINTAGKMSWNSNSHYFFRYDTEKLKEEISAFENTISMEVHLGAEESLLRSEFIRSLTSKQKRTKSTEQLISEYSVFLNSFFKFCEDILIMNFQIPPELKILFLYHIAPPHFFMIARKFLAEVNTGYLHVQSPDGKRVTKIVPNEYIKKNLIQYWEKHIMLSVGDERNNLATLKKISEIVEARYKEISKFSIQEYDKLPQEVKASKPRVQIFREKMNEWMGAANIIVFKRFLKNEALG